MPSTSDPSPTITSTADLWDSAPDRLRMLQCDWRDYGGLATFSGRVSTLRTAESHASVRSLLGQPGDGRVLAIDAGGDRRIAMLGDVLGALGAANGWIGVVVNGVIRDGDALGNVALGVKALGRTAMRSFASEAPSESDVTVEIGGVAVNPGDWVYADGDAVLVSRERLETGGDWRSTRAYFPQP